MSNQKIDFYTWFRNHPRNSGNDKLFENKEGMRLAFEAGLNNKLLKVYEMVCDCPEYPINETPENVDKILQQLNKQITEIYDYLTEVIILDGHMGENCDSENQNELTPPLIEYDRYDNRELNHHNDIRRCLRKLVDLKSHKDFFGKDKHYEQFQPEAWDEAVKLVGSVDTDPDE